MFVSLFITFLLCPRSWAGCPPVNYFLLLMAYSSWALPCPPLIARSPDCLPSSMQTRGRYSVASNPPQLHVARYGCVFLSVASSPREAFGLLMRLNGDDLHLVNCGWRGQRGAIFCQLWYEREAGNQRCVGLQYWSYGGCKVCGGSSEWPTCQTHQCDRKGTSLWTTFHTSTARLELRTSDKNATWYSAWC